MPAGPKFFHTQHAIFPLRLAAAAALLLLLSAVVSAQAPSILWRYDTRDASYGQTAAGDIDGDGRLEVVFGCYRNDSSVHALNAEDGSLLWKVNTARLGRDGCNDVAPAIHDVNGDGRPEVLLPASCTAATFCFDGRNGTPLWTAPTRGSDSPPTIADIDGDGVDEMLHGEFGGWVRCLNVENGALEWELEVDGHSWIQTAPTLLDCDGDGALDFVVATWNSVEGDTNTVRAYRCSDRALLWSVPLGDVVYHGSAVADFDGDGLPELALGDYNGTLIVLNAEDGSIAWSKPSLGVGHYIGAPVSAGDIDGDGRCDLVVVSWYSVRAFRGDGGMLWEHAIQGYGTAFRGVVLADVNDDAALDVVFGTSNGLLVALDGRDGGEVWSVDLAADVGDERFAIDHAPVLADFDADGLLDVFVVGGFSEYPDFSANYGRAFMLSIGRGSGPPWLMFQNNLRRNSSLCAGTPQAVGENDVPETADLRCYPQPMRDALRVEMDDMRSCRLIDMLGRIVLEADVARGAASFDVSRLPGGLYIVQGRASERVLARTVLKLH